MSPSPLPVVVTNAPGTDWWAQLLDGFVGAVIAAAVETLLLSGAFWAVMTLNPPKAGATPFG
ncbi:MAG: hypothetical protein M3P04_06670 [Actinomycetota bacterium]|nr:hypothetical protein [Actinomycetota bacterium]